MGLGYTEEDVGDWRRFHKRVDVSASWKTHPESQYSTMIDELPKDCVKYFLNLKLSVAYQPLKVGVCF